MRATISSLFLLICFMASAQLPVIQLFQKQPSSGGFDTTQMAYHWNAADLTTNAAISGNWNDEIQSFAFLQGNSTKQPTNSSSGVWFDSNHWVTNTGAIISSNVAFGFVIKITSVVGTGSGIMPGLMGNSFSGADGAGRLDYRFDSNTTYPLATANNGTVGDFNNGLAGFVLTNVYFDMIISQTISNNGNMGMRVYTNGTIMETLNITSTRVSSGSYWGSAGGNKGASTAPSFLCLNRSRNTSASLFLFDYAIWTNASPGAANGSDLPATQIANYHTFNKNKYGY